MNCKNHDDKPAKFFCTSCVGVYCLDCVRKFLAGEFYTYFCPDCNSPCDDFSEEKYQTALKNKPAEKEKPKINVKSPETPIVKPQAKSMLKSSKPEEKPKPVSSGLMQAKQIKIEQPKVKPPVKETTPEAETNPATEDENSKIEETPASHSTEETINTEDIPSITPTAEEIQSEQLSNLNEQLDKKLDEIDNIEALEKLLEESPPTDAPEEFKSRGILAASKDEKNELFDIPTRPIDIKSTNDDSNNATTETIVRNKTSNNPAALLLNLFYSLFNPNSGFKKLMTPMENSPVSQVFLFFYYLLFSFIVVLLLLDRFSIFGALIFTSSATIIYAAMQTLLILPIKPPSASAVFMYSLTIQSFFLIPLNYIINKLNTPDWIPVIIPGTLALLLWKLVVIVFSLSSRYGVSRLIIFPITLASLLLSSYISLFLLSSLN